MKAESPIRATSTPVEPSTCPPSSCPGHYPRRWATTGTLSPWALLPVGDPVVVCLVRSTFRASIRPLPLLLAGCVLPEDHGGEAQTPVRQESGYQRLSRRCRSHPLGLEFKQSSLAHAWPNSRTPIDPLTLGLTSLQPHAVVPSLLSVEGKRLVLPAFFQRGRDVPDKTRQTLATAHAEARHADAGCRTGRRPMPLPPRLRS